MKSSEFINECTSAGSVAAVTMPMGKVIKRTNEEEKQTTTKTTKYNNKAKQPVKVKDIY